LWSDYGSLQVESMLKEDKLPGFMEGITDKESAWKKLTKAP
jgi:hypothetical protein